MSEEPYLTTTVQLTLMAARAHFAWGLSISEAVELLAKLSKFLEQNNYPPVPPARAGSVIATHIPSIPLLVTTIQPAP